MKIKPHNDLEGCIEGVPAFRCRLTAQGTWVFNCTCGKEHVHGLGQGHRAGHCAHHRPYGYWLLGPASSDETEAL